MYSTLLIRDPNELDRLALDWDLFVNQWAPSPMFSLEFVKLLFRPSLSPDIVVEPQLLGVFLENMLEFGNSSQPRYFDLTLPSDSPTLDALEEKRETNGYVIGRLPVQGHKVLSINSTWSQFINQKGRKFRQNIRALQAKMERAGKWNITYSDFDGSSETIKKILEIERRSWKEVMRSHSSGESDPELSAILKASVPAKSIDKGFRPLIWFLELNGQTIAYNIALCYKGTAYMAKTSFDDSFRDLSPGIFLNNRSIEDLFESKQVERMDFLTDLPFQSRWTTTSLARARILVSQRGAGSAILPLFSSVIKTLGKTKETSRVQRAILHRL